MSTSAVTATMDRNLVLVGRACPVDWLNVLIILFVLSMFVSMFCALRHSRLTGSRFIGYYRRAQAGLQDRVRLLRRPECTAGALRRWREHSKGQDQLGFIE